MKKPDLKETWSLTVACADMMSPGAYVGIIILIWKILILFPVYYLLQFLKNFQYLIK